MFLRGRMLISKIAWTILMIYLCIYIGEEGGCTNACICMGTHSQPLLQNRLIDVYKTWYGWSAHGHANALRCFGYICPGTDPERCQYRSLGVPYLKKSSSDRKATATNWMHSNDLEGKKCCYFWYHSTSNFWRVFYVFLDLVMLACFNAIFQ